MTDVSRSDLADRIRACGAGRPRILVAIAGSPGSGKSTLAAELALELGHTAAAVPMDGFHLDNDELQRRGLLHRKGMPETFDVAAFHALLVQLTAGGAVRYPTFDRAADRVVEGGGVVEASVRFVVVEGNYLLLDEPGWSSLHELWDLTIRLDVPPSELKQRLLRRWLDQGLSRDEALRRALDNDLANAERVARHSRPADLVLV
ncbi:hypothetical protein R5H32_14365 [Defluviimonas sp. D31]|uniref:hypothetical protein n=1 Tax=Defluviimonas sp. D31 TaxID=3083253 RepID=UPI00296ED20F|nr:hypothetical protein [Defluviimonas sp. D31]MDW4550543.1 hypothetical protein [Defluviimonas sp. D31]